MGLVPVFTPGSFHSIPSVVEGKFRDTNHVVV